jgi:hypothetical protein
VSNKIIKNNVPKCPTIDWHSCNVIQGNLKSEEDLNKLEFSLIKRGIVFPFFLWVRDKDDCAIIDGSRRTKVLESLEKKGYKIDPLPYVPIEANSFDDAKAKILLASSIFGTPTKSGFLTFANDIPVNQLKKELSEISYKFLYANKKADRTAQRPKEVDAVDEEDSDEEDSVITGKGSVSKTTLEKVSFKIEFKTNKDYNQFWKYLEEIKQIEMLADSMENIFFQTIESVALG